MRRLAYACDLTTKCMSKSCTEANTETIILPVLVRGMDDAQIQADLLEVYQMLLGDTVAFIAIREADAMAAKAMTHARFASSRPMLKQDSKKTKDTTSPRVQDAQDTTATEMMPPNPMPPEHEENVQMQLTVNINTNTGPATSINQIVPHSRRMLPREGNAKGKK